MAAPGDAKAGFYAKNDVYSNKMARTHEGFPVFTNYSSYDYGYDVRGFGGKHDEERKIMGDQPVVFTDKDRFNYEIQLLPIRELYL